MLNQRAQILLDIDTKNLLIQAASAMNVSFSEAIRHATTYAYKTKKLHNQRILAAKKITSIRKSLNLHLTVKEIKQMAHYGHKY